MKKKETKHSKKKKNKNRNKGEARELCASRFCRQWVKGSTARRFARKVQRQHSPQTYINTYIDIAYIDIAITTYMVYLYICFLLLFPVKWFVYLFALLNAGSNTANCLQMP